MNNEIQKRTEEIRVRENKVKPGPFINGQHGFDGEYIATEDGTPIATTRGPAKESWALAEFFAHARADIPWLLEQLNKVKEEAKFWSNENAVHKRAANKARDLLNESDVEIRRLKKKADELVNELATMRIKLSEQETEIDRLKKALENSQDEKTLLAMCYCSQLDGGYRCDSCKERIKKYGE